VAAEDDDARAGRLVAGDHPQRGCLAAAGRPQEAAVRASGDPQADAVDRDDRAIPLGRLDQLQRGRRAAERLAHRHAPAGEQAAYRLRARRRAPAPGAAMWANRRRASTRGARPDAGGPDLAVLSDRADASPPAAICGDPGNATAGAGDMRRV